jgi:pimeloyl-ACP methyl ester carboxylesterase
VLSPADETDKTVVIQPLRPLNPETSYMVVLTNGIRAAVDGSPAFPDQTYLFARYRGDLFRPIVNAAGQSNFRMLTDAQAQSLARLQPLVHSQENAAAGQGIGEGDIVLSWTFTTQSIADVLEVVRAEAMARPAQLTTADLTTQDINPQLAGIADIYTGTLQIPYFLEAPTTPETWPVILITFWKGSNDSILTRYNPMPVPPQPNLTIPLLITVPNAGSGQSKPDEGWPVVIFQHGLGGNRTQMLAVADVLALAGFAVVAIDLPLHGITDTNNPFYNAPVERTFNVDFVNNETLMPPPDGQIDPSGLWSTNFSSLLTTRDNGRQAIADLFQLTATVPTLDIDENPSTADFDGEQIHFVGYSTGGIAGTGFLALEQAVTAATIANAGGGLANLTVASAATGPLALAALETVGIVPGTSAFQQFLVAFQTTVDAIDPINYAKAAADTHPIYMIEVVGSETSPSDQVVPNRIPGAPLSGTEPLTRLMDLRPITTTTELKSGIRGIVRFTQGNHGSFLSPEAPPEDTASPAATEEMQSEMAGFMESQGTVLPVIDPEVVQTMPSE